MKDEIAQGIVGELRLIREELQNLTMAVRSAGTSRNSENSYAGKPSFFNKTEESNWKVAWHQDLTIMIRERDEVAGFGPWTVKEDIVHVQPTEDVLGRILAIRLHLDASEPDNEPLRVVPGSHKHGRLSSEQVSAYPKEGSMVCTVPRGGALRASRGTGLEVDLMRLAWITAFAAAIFFSSASPIGAQELTKLRAGFTEECALGPKENHVFTVSLDAGAAIVGEADQHGIDLVIEEFAPDGKLIRVVDSPNGTEGPEPIDLTALAPGQYKLVIHALEPSAKPGKYVIKIDRMYNAEENGLRVAEKNYPPALLKLWKDFIADPRAVERFVADRKGKGPLIDAIKGDDRNLNVTYLYYGDGKTEKVEVFGSTHASVGGTQLDRFLRTPLFFGTETVPKDSRYRYGFIVTETSYLGAKGTIQVSNERNVPDPLNTDIFDDLSVLVLPAAPPQPYVAASDGVPRGKVVPSSTKSNKLNEDRTISLYTPPGYDGTTASDLLIVFDGETYDGSLGSQIPTPTILDNLIAAKKIGPTVAIFVNNMGQRVRDLGGYAPFADFLALELIPWARANYHIKNGPEHVVVAGSSRGGLAASHCAFYHSDVVGNVLSQSGAYFVRNDDRDAPPWPLTADTGDMVLVFRNSPRLPIKFYMEVGRFDSLLDINRELRDILLVKGYPVTYREFDGGHDYFYWRGSLADGLITLIGQSRPE